MIRGLLCGLIIAILAVGWATAKTATLRSGEHEAFTRLVITFPEGAKWSIDQNDTGIVVHLDNGPWTFDLSRAFDRIPQLRVKDIQPLKDLSGLQIGTAENVAVSSFALGREGVAIDISNSPPALERLPLPDAALNLPLLPPTLDEAPVSTLTPIDPRVSQAEAQLLRQLGRASAQGAIRQTDLKRTPTVPFLGAAYGITAHTIMDDGAGASAIPPTAPFCAPDIEFDATSWVSDAPFPAQLARARTALVKEFDQPDPAAIIQLAKTYIGFGMATEARQLLDTFPQPLPSQAQTLRAMADILDSRQTAGATNFAQMTGCNGLVALWAVMAQPTLSHDNDINIQAVLRNYSALPIALRDVLQQPLIDRMLAIDARDAASAVKNALARDRDQNANNADLSVARLAFSSGAAALAAQASAPLSNGPDMTAVYALSLQMMALAAEDQAVPRDITMKAGDLSRALGKTREAYLMRQAQTIGLGSVGEFDNAFDILDDWPADAEPDFRRQTEANLFDHLSRVPDDTLFLASALPRQRQIMLSDIGLIKQISISERFSKLGFGTAGEAVLSAATVQDERGKRALAKALLTKGNSAGAVAVLDGVEGPAADALRAQALAGIGEHGAAAALYATLGDKVQAAQQAWRSGSNETIRDFGTDIQKEAIESSPPPPIADSNVLTRASLALELSRKDRETTEKLLKEIPPD